MQSPEVTQSIFPRDAAMAAFLTGGVNSDLEPEFLPRDQYAWAINLDNAKGLPRTRSGNKITLQLPPGRLQGMCWFRPTRQMEHLVFAVAGKVYASPFPFTGYFQLPNLQFNPVAKQVYLCVAERGGEPDASNNNAKILIAPRWHVMIQDGITNPGYWDGVANAHVDPANNQTPIGTWMTYYKGRLWVAIAANTRSPGGFELAYSDIADPLFFLEYGLLAEGGSYRFAKPITGLAPTPNKDSLIIFLYNETHILTIPPGTKTMADTKVTPNYLRQLSDDVGCVAGKSICTHYGNLWWYSNQRLTNWHTLLASLQSDSLHPIDLEMNRSYETFPDDLSGMCAVSHRNYLLVSTPAGSTTGANRETWALNSAPGALLNQALPPAWQGVWTGFNPVEWASGYVNGVLYTFMASQDNDGNNRIWQAFQKDRTDNGGGISCLFESRLEVFGNYLALIKIRYYELLVQKIFGNVNLKGWWKGFRGEYKAILDRDILTTPAYWECAEDEESMPKRYQTRDVYSQEVVNTAKPTCVDCGIESNLADTIDHGFGILLIWTGEMALAAYRIFEDAKPEITVGKYYKETRPSQLASCPDPRCLEYQPPYSQQTQFTASGSATFTCPVEDTGGSTTVDITYVSSVSQADADAQAVAVAQAQAEAGTYCIPIRTYTSTQTVTITCLTGPAGYQPSEVQTQTATATSNVSQTDADNAAIAIATAAAQALLLCTFYSTQTVTVPCPTGIGAPQTATASATSTVSQAAANAAAMAAAYAAASAMLVCENLQNFIMIGGQQLYGSAYVESFLNNGAADPSWTGLGGANQIVYAVAENATKTKFAIGGSFTTFNGVAHPYLVVVNQHGVIDGTYSFGIGPDGPVFDIIFNADGSLFISGDFQNFNGNPSQRIAKLTNTGAFDGTFAVGAAGFDGVVRKMAVDASGNVICVGTFKNFATTVKNNIALLSSTGVLNPTWGGVEAAGPPATFSGANGTIYDLAIQPSDGRIILVGSFTRYQGVLFTGLIRVNGTDGSIDTTFSSASSASCFAVAIQGTDILIGSSSQLQRFQSDGTLDPTFPTIVVGGNINVIRVLTDGRLFVGGAFPNGAGLVNIGSFNPPFCAILSAQGVIDPSFVPFTSNTVYDAGLIV